MGEPEAKRAKTENIAAVAEKFSPPLDAYDIETQKALEDVDKVQADIDVINEKATEEIVKIEQKYNALRKPHFEKRNALIKKIPNFWVTAFVNHPTLSKALDEEEEECLHYLTKIEIEEFEDIKNGYRIKFFFDPNPYFENEMIVKEYQWNQANPKLQNTEMKWKPGKKLGNMSANGQANGSGASAEKTFFSWLCYNTDPVTDDFSEMIKDDIWPNPLQYYLVPDVDEDDLSDDGLDDDDEGLDDLDDEEADLDDLEEGPEEGEGDAN